MFFPVSKMRLLNITPELLAKLRSFLTESRRVLRVTRKPTGTEFKTIVQITGLGIMLIGLVGFILHLFKTLFFKI